MTSPGKDRPVVLIVSGPSGSGKSTLVQKLLELPDTDAIGFVYNPSAA